MATKKKFYAVRRGRTPGVYTTWAECQRQTKGFSGAEFKSFPSPGEAEAWIGGSADGPRGAAPSASGGTRTRRGKAAADEGPRPEAGISVDGGCRGNPGPMDYRGVDLATGDVVFSEGPYDGGTNNLAEYLAIVDAAQRLERGEHPGPIYSDSRTAMGWVERGHHRSKVRWDRADPALRVLCDAADAWLAARDTPPPVHFWSTKAWGDIPADYGRKG
ncbi:MAG: viroplasmin family protein [Phycisphaerales bacterium]